VTTEHTRLMLICGCLPVYDVRRLLSSPTGHKYKLLLVL